MSEYEIRLLIEREKRKVLARKIAEWERANGGIRLMPMKRDVTRGRIDQLVDDALEHERKQQKGLA